MLYNLGMVDNLNITITDAPKSNFPVGLLFAGASYLESIMETVKKILWYQRRIQSVLACKDKHINDLEHVILDKIGHEADSECYIHALKDLIASGHVIFNSPMLKVAV